MRERIIKRMPTNNTLLEATRLNNALFETTGLNDTLFEATRPAMGFLPSPESLYLLQQFSFGYDPFLL